MNIIQWSEKFRLDKFLMAVWTHRAQQAAFFGKFDCTQFAELQRAEATPRHYLADDHTIFWQVVLEIRDWNML